MIFNIDWEIEDFIMQDCDIVFFLLILAVVLIFGLIMLMFGSIVKADKSSEQNDVVYPYSSSAADSLRNFPAPGPYWDGHRSRYDDRPNRSYRNRTRERSSSNTPRRYDDYDNERMRNDAAMTSAIYASDDGGSSTHHCSSHHYDHSSHSSVDVGNSSTDSGGSCDF